MPSAAVKQRSAIDNRASSVVHEERGTMVRCAGARVSALALPWWWLRSDELEALGIGQGAERTALGVVFGDPSSPLRVELVPSAHDGPLRVGCVAVRLWTRAPVDARAPLQRIARLLASRRGDDFRPDETEALLAAQGTAVTSPSAPPAARTIIVDVPSVCDRACSFCGVSRTPEAQRRPIGSAEAVERRIASASAGDTVLFTGMDALSNESIVEWVALAARRAARPVLIGPPRPARSAALAARLADAGLSRYQTGLFGDTASSHDAIAGRLGAFAALVEACDAFGRARVEIELVTPLVRPLLPALVAIARAAARLTSQPLTLLAYAPDPVVGRAFDDVVAPYDELSHALTAVAGERVRLDALPLCVIPDPLRAAAPSRLDRSDDELTTRHPADPCDGCAARTRCPGVPHTVLAAVGTRGLAPLSAR
jgi:hypothetical protein